MPDTIDAIRLSRRPSLDWAESIRLTDEALGLGTGWWSPVSADKDRNIVVTPTAERSVAGSAKTCAALPKAVAAQLETPAKARVGVLGYGVIGRRVADAVRAQPDMEVVGIAGRPASFSLRGAQLRQYDVYVTTPAAAEDAASRCCRIRGSLEDLLSKCDVLLDCTPSHVPGEYAALYERFPQLTVIVQGGEKHSFGGISFNAFANYAQAVGKKRVRVISCSSTGTARFVFALDQAFGLKRAFAALTRRGADPGKPGKTPYNALKPTMGQSHHAPDVRTVLPNIDLFSVSVDVPTTFGHVINFQAEVSGARTRDDVAEALDSMPRVVVGRGLSSTADLAELYQDFGRSRRDRPEIYVWEESIAVEGPAIYATISVHMESITIPDTVDCIRAGLGMEDNNWVSIHRTDCALGIEKKCDSYQRPITV